MDSLGIRNIVILTTLLGSSSVSCLSFSILVFFNLFKNSMVIILTNLVTHNTFLNIRTWLSINRLCLNNIARWYRNGKWHLVWKIFLFKLELFTILLHCELIDFCRFWSKIFMSLRCHIYSLSFIYQFLLLYHVLVHFEYEILNFKLFNKIVKFQKNFY